MFALVNAFHPRMLWLMVWPLLVAGAIWITVAVFFWAELAVWLAAIVKQWVQTATFFISWDAGDVALFAAKVLIWIMLIPLIQLTGLLILSVFGMDAMVRHVAEQRFPQLARLKGGSFAGSVANSIAAMAGLVGLAVITLPAWIFPPLWLLIPPAIMAWVNQCVLRYDALAEHASADERRSIIRANRAALYGLGLVLALVFYVPVVNLVAPVFVALAFIHFLLAELEALRTAPIEGKATLVS